MFYALYLFFLPISKYIISVVEQRCTLAEEFWFPRKELGFARGTDWSN